IPAVGVRVDLRERVGQRLRPHERERARRGVPVEADHLRGRDSGGACDVGRRRSVVGHGRRGGSHYRFLPSRVPPASDPATGEPVAGGAEVQSMRMYVARRLIYSIPVLVVSSFLIFTFVASSTDPLEAVRMRPNVNQQAILLIEKEKHLKDPMVVRYGYWVKDVLTNDFGTGVLDDRPILPDLERVLKNTLQLIVAAEILSILIGCGIGILSAIRQYSWFDHSATTFSFLGAAVPVFWLALSLQIL